MYCVLRDFAPASNGLPVIHCAPDKIIAEILEKRYGDCYRPADFSPEEYSWVNRPVSKLDLTKPSEYLKPNSVQGIVHMHVLEHIPADLNRVVREMNDAIVPGGFHALCVPFFSRFYREDMDPGMSHDDRDRLFGQFDHVRSFGTEDANERLHALFDGFQRVDLKSAFAHDLLAASAIPTRAATSPTSHSVFLYIKNSL